MSNNSKPSDNNLRELRIDNVCCWKGEKCLFQQVSFTLKSGEITQLEGENGVGKTSLMRIIAGLSRPEVGDVRWCGQSIYSSPDSYHANLLYIGHKPGLKDVLTAAENLSFYQETIGEHNPQAVYDALSKIGLQSRENIPVRQLSAGQQRRVALARLHLSKAKVWLLDEPFTAIDKKGVEDLVALFKAHCNQGGIILFTSHQSVADSAIQSITLAGTDL